MYETYREFNFNPDTCVYIEDCKWKIEKEYDKSIYC